MLTCGHPSLTGEREVSGNSACCEGSRPGGFFGRRHFDVFACHGMQDDILKLSDRVTRVMGLNPGTMTLQGTCTYVLGTGDARILLDTGEGKPEYAQLLARVLPLGVRISHIVLTHWHHDHIGMNE